jgi:hypothetical protein
MSTVRAGRVARAGGRFCGDEPSVNVVLRSRPLRDGTETAALSRFGEDIWHVKPAHPRRTSTSPRRGGNGTHRSGPEHSKRSSWPLARGILEWERVAAADVFNQVRAFIEATDGETAELGRTRKGGLISRPWARWHLPGARRNAAFVRHSSLPPGRYADLRRAERCCERQ